jgi:hypothetical protein
MHSQIVKTPPTLQVNARTVSLFNALHAELLKAGHAEAVFVTLEEINKQSCLVMKGPKAGSMVVVSFGNHYHGEMFTNFYPSQAKFDYYCLPYHPDRIDDGSIVTHACITGIDLPEYRDQYMALIMPQITAFLFEGKDPENDLYNTSDMVYEMVKASHRK